MHKGAQTVLEAKSGGSRLSADTATQMTDWWCCSPHIAARRGCLLAEVGSHAQGLTTLQPRAGRGHFA
eukprot:6025891-Pyramimonas_sp.AAC.1